MDIELVGSVLGFIALEIHNCPNSEHQNDVISSHKYADHTY